MAIKYDLYRTQVVSDRTGPPRYCPRPIATDSRTFLQMCEDIATGNTFTPGDVTGVFKSLVQEITRDLKLGRRVYLPGLGTFAISLTTDKPIFEGDIPHASNIRVSRVFFRASRTFHDEVYATQIIRSRIRKMEPQQDALRRKLILREISISGYVTSSDVMEMNHCSRKTACKDLNVLIKGGVLRKYGCGIACFYTGTALGLLPRVTVSEAENV